MKTIYAVLQNNKVEMSANFDNNKPFFTLEYNNDITNPFMAKDVFISLLLSNALHMGGEEIVIYDADNKTKETSSINADFNKNWKKAKKLSKVFSIKDGNISLDGEKILIFDKQ